MNKFKNGYGVLVSDNENLWKHLESMKETAVSEIRKLKLKLLRLKKKKVAYMHYGYMDYHSNDGFQFCICHYYLVCRMLQNNIDALRHSHRESYKNELHRSNFLDVLRIVSLQKYMEYIIRKYAEVKRSRKKEPRKILDNCEVIPTKHFVCRETQKILMKHAMSSLFVQHIASVFLS